MPLIIISGIPSSGKSKRCNELKEYFEKEHKRKVDVISELECIVKRGYDKNSYFADSKNEKSIRSDIRSSIQHLLNQKDILIIDGSNYIKGYRYELYCLSKSLKTPQCTVYCDIPVEHAWLLNQNNHENQRYSREIFDALVMRYEPPDNRNRWDAPLFSVTFDDKLPLQDIYHSLFLVKAPKPNMSTQSPPVSSTNYLYDLDRISQDIVNAIISAEKMGLDSDIKLPDYNLTVEKGANASQLNRLRRQFLTYSKMHQIDTNKIPQLFVQYLNKSI